MFWCNRSSNALLSSLVWCPKQAIEVTRGCLIDFPGMPNKLDINKGSNLIRFYCDAQRDCQRDLLLIYNCSWLLTRYCQRDLSISATHGTSFGAVRNSKGTCFTEKNSSEKGKATKDRPLLPSTEESTGVGGDWLWIFRIMSCKG